MQIPDLLQQLRPAWLNRMASVSIAGDDYRERLNQSYTLWLQSVETGQAAWLDGLIQLWLAAPPFAEGEDASLNLPHLIGEMMMATHEVVREALEPQQALEVLNGFAPSFAYAFEKAAGEAAAKRIRSELNDDRQKVERLDQSKSDFIALAAHELRTPLTLVEGYSAMLHEALAGRGDDESWQLLLSGIERGTYRLKGLIDDMIDVSMIDNHLLALNFQPVWVNRLLQVLESDLSSSLQERQQKLVLNPYPGWNEMTYGDPERLLQAFRNVLINAIKFTPDEGQITVGGRKLPGFLEVTFTDSGIGIDMENQQVIFEKFSQLGDVALHSSGKTKYKGGGPGLGLPITKGIIEAHGGAIWVESQGFDETGCPGSTFHILLPLRNAPPDTRAAKFFTTLINHQLNANH